MAIALSLFFDFGILQNFKLQNIIAFKDRYAFKNKI